ncbi:MAG: hypothetical protein HUJ25_13060 [Crocinitomicaceae bacterium]|nr:hypothetical protein [Crocinitomicaceae bacterium]
MKHLLLLISLLPLQVLAQGKDLSCEDCWFEYKTEPAQKELPPDYCPLGICADGSFCCILWEENETYKSVPCWTKLSDDRLQFDGEEVMYFKIIKWTESEIILEPENEPSYKWYFKKG